MNRTTRQKVRSAAAIGALAVLGTIALSAGAVEAGEGPVCTDGEAPVCEEPPAPPRRLRLTIVSPDAPGF